MDTKTFAFILIVAVAGIGVGYYVGYDIGFKRAAEGVSIEDDGMTGKEGGGVTTGSMRVGKNALYVSDQMPGNMVVVEFVNFAENGFVVVHESKVGKPGVILGKSALVPAGGDQKITISLSRVSRDGEELVAMLHRDDGDGVFDAAKDAPVKDDTGNTIMMPFSISRDAVAPDAASW